MVFSVTFHSGKVTQTDHSKRGHGSVEIMFDTNLFALTSDGVKAQSLLKLILVISTYADFSSFAVVA